MYLENDQLILIKFQFSVSINSSEKLMMSRKLNINFFKIISSLSKKEVKALIF